MTKVLILTEAGEGVGLGHLSRCTAIYEELEDAKLLCAKFGGYKLPDFVEESNWLENEVECHEFDTVLIDSYLMSESKERELREKFTNLIVLDDYNRKIYDADLIVNPNIYGNELDYSNQKCRVIGGKEFVTIRSDIVKNKKPKPITFLKNLLITVGGTDRHNLLPKLIENFKDDFVKTTVLVGSSKQQEALEKKHQDIQVLANLDPKDLVALYNSTDLAITAGGVTMGELTFCGTAFVAVKTSEDQKHNIDAYKEAGIIDETIEAEDPQLLEKLESAIEHLKDENRRKDLSFRSQILINGKGARNIAQEIESF